jgi:hypothetical protein
MLQKLWEVAPPLTWGILTSASAFLLTGFVLLSHALVRHKAYEDRYSGLLRRGRLESTLRTGIGFVLAGGALWAYALSAPGWVLVALVAFTGLAFSAEGAALVRGG